MMNKMSLSWGKLLKGRALKLKINSLENTKGYVCKGTCARVHVRGYMCEGTCVRVHVRGYVCEGLEHNEPGVGKGAQIGP